MAGRYSRDFDLDFSGVTAQPEAPKKRKTDPVEEMLRIAGGLAPAAGAGVGALVGGGVPGAIIGSGIGAGLGGLANYGADALGRDDREAEDERLAREEEKRARNEVAAGIIGGWR